MTPKEFEEAMDKIYSNPFDIRIAHYDADKLMCDVLRQLGYEDGVEIYNMYCHQLY